ncbi:MAG: nucleoside phosphorylase [Bacteroidales bacterium]|nr:nucleoside phosphorylase [Bacteroidales bacterium]
MSRIPESQLVLHTDGSMYHLRLKPGQVAETIMLVGDPQRVQIVSSFFDTIEHKVHNREIITHTGTFKGKKMTVMSTGMGTDNIDIVMNELDALVNIDLKNRTLKEKHTSLNLIRIGTSGALQDDIDVGDSYVAGAYALGLDGMIFFYDNAEAVIEHDMTTAFKKHMHWPSNLPSPYIVKASERLLNTFANDCVKGITATAPGFYGPQGRSLRLPLGHPMINNHMESFNYQGNRITNFEMESSALYGLSRMLGHEALTICVMIANRVTEKFAGDYRPFMEKLIINTLNKALEL